MPGLDADQARGSLPSPVRSRSPYVDRVIAPTMTRGEGERSQVLRSLTLSTTPLRRRTGQHRRSGLTASRTPSPRPAPACARPRPWGAELLPSEEYDVARKEEAAVAQVRTYTAALAAVRNGDRKFLSYADRPVKKRASRRQSQPSGQVGPDLRGCGHRADVYTLGATPAAATTGAAP
jgi:hypothetical protein